MDTSYIKRGLEKLERWRERRFMQQEVASVGINAGGYIFGVGLN